MKKTIRVNLLLLTTMALVACGGGGGGSNGAGAASAANGSSSTSSADVINNPPPSKAESKPNPLSAYIGTYKGVQCESYSARMVGGPDDGSGSLKGVGSLVVTDAGNQTLQVKYVLKYYAPTDTKCQNIPLGEQESLVTVSAQGYTHIEGEPRLDRVIMRQTLLRTTSAGESLILQGNEIGAKVPTKDTREQLGQLRWIGENVDVLWGNKNNLEYKELMALKGSQLFFGLKEPLDSEGYPTTLSPWSIYT